MQAISLQDGDSETDQPEISAIREQLRQQNQSIRDLTATIDDLRQVMGGVLQKGRLTPASYWTMVIFSLSSNWGRRRELVRGWGGGSGGRDQCHTLFAWHLTICMWLWLNQNAVVSPNSIRRVLVRLMWIHFLRWVSPCSCIIYMYIN